VNIVNTLGREEMTVLDFRLALAQAQRGGGRFGMRERPNSPPACRKYLSQLAIRT